MKLITFTQGGTTRIGALTNNAVIDFSSAAPDLPTSMRELFEAGDGAMAKAKEAAASGEASLPLADVSLESPVPNPSKILAVGLNYMDHFNEVKEVRDIDLPKDPIIFNKQNTSVTGPYSDIYLPPESEQLDYEGELAIVIGKRCRRVSQADAGKVIAGFTICNDVSVRDWQMKAPTMMMGKSWDSHCPLGPALVTTDEVDHANLNFRTLVNGEVRQESNTRHLIFNCERIVEFLSTAFTLEPGDIIPTGTTSGVAVWMKGQPWLKEGDVVRVEFDTLGHIENKVVNDPVGSFIV